MIWSIPSPSALQLWPCILYLFGPGCYIPRSCLHVLWFRIQVSRFQATFAHTVLDLSDSLSLSLSSNRLYVAPSHIVVPAPCIYVLLFRVDVVLLHICILLSMISTSLLLLLPSHIPVLYRIHVFCSVVRPLQAMWPIRAVFLSPCSIFISFNFVLTPSRPVFMPPCSC